MRESGGWEMRVDGETVVFQRVKAVEVRGRISS